MHLGDLKPIALGAGVGLLIVLVVALAPRSGSTTATPTGAPDVTESPAVTASPAVAESPGGEAQAPPSAPPELAGEPRDGNPLWVALERNIHPSRDTPLAWVPDDADVPLGSGCTPREGNPPLPDGVWFGYVDAWKYGAIEFDLACYFSPESAYARGVIAATGVEPHYIRNTNAQRRNIAVHRDAVLFPEGDIARFIFTEAGTPAQSHGALPREVWIYIDEGRIVAVEELPPEY